jgi:hypothetical protein
MTLLVLSDLGLADGVSRLVSHPYYFIVHGGNIQGIVTRADLQRPAVGMVLFSPILASEAAINTVIGRCLGPSWIERLSAGRQARIRKFYDDRLRTNTEVTMLECLMLRDRLNLLGECHSVVSRSPAGRPRASPMTPTPAPPPARTARARPRSAPPARG